MKRRARSKPGRHSQPRRVVLTAFCAGLVVILLALGIYVGAWYLNLGRIRGEGERYAALYGRGDAPGGVEASAPPQPSPTPKASAAPTRKPAVQPTIKASSAQAPTAETTAAASPIPTRTPTAAPTAQASPVPTQTPSPAPTPATGPSETSVPFGGDMPLVEDVLIPTPGSDTLVYALPTAPPVQDSFSALLALNPETVGFLEIGDMLALPVVQRENDNDYYLSHAFEGQEASEGTLFLDGFNRLVPEDDCLIVYGHNMKNKTMFGKLSSYGDVRYLRRHSVIRFDTLYESRSYVAFAAFTADMDPRNSRYFDVRQFIFDEAGFDKFVLKLQSRSLFASPIEVAYGDGLLLLVTCDYTSREGRFILALRQLRPGESEADVRAQAMLTAVK